jgi:Protein of unknown function (DUF3300)
MNAHHHSRAIRLHALLVALASAAFALTGVASFQAVRAQAPAQEPSAAPIPPDQLDSLVAPIALYPDPLLAQVLAASTYPVEIIQLQQWLAKNPGLKDKALEDAVAKQPWDPSVQGLAGLPDVVKRLADDIQWTTDLGNAFLAQQKDVMDAVQRMRAKAQEKGNLSSNQQQTVETKTVENQQVIVIEQANPQVVYVPSYNPTVIYGPPPYPYPPVYYPPPPPPGSMLISFGIGMAMGAAMGGAWGYGCGWGGSSTVVINNNNNYVRTGGGGGGNWQHNSAHRGGAPYANRATANRYGGQGGGAGGRPGQVSSADRGAGQGGGAAGRPGQVSTPDRSAGQGRAATSAGGGADRIGNQDLSGGAGAGGRGSSRGDAGGRGAFGGGNDGYSGSRASASSSRGSRSMGSRGGGGRRR